MDKAMAVFEGISTKTADTYNWIVRALAEVLQLPTLNYIYVP